jgi:hypothetical protein
MAYMPGDRVTHAQYGDGTLVRANEFHTVINFDEHGVRTFSSPRVVLAASSSVAPPAPARRRGRTKRAATSRE